MSNWSLLVQTKEVLFRMETIPEEDNAQGKRDYNIFEGRKGSSWSLHNGNWYIVSV